MLLFFYYLTADGSEESTAGRVVLLKLVGYLWITLFYIDRQYVNLASQEPRETKAYVGKDDKINNDVATFQCLSY